MATVGRKVNGIQMVGLPELQRALKAVGDGVDKEFRKELRGISKLVVKRAQGKMGGYSNATKKLLRPSVTAKGAGILMPAGGAGIA